MLAAAMPRGVIAQERGIAALADTRAGLGVHTRVLMIGAHPDDEDTPIIAWLARGHRAETAYLSLTRGDGGQNLIGNELGEALGVIRTEELLAARRVDGAHQYFTRAYDFGFSKTAQESFKHWPHDSLLGDIVKVIRAFRPQVVISVFSGTPRDGHGQHQVAGILSKDAYELAADTVRFPERVYGKAWTPLKLYMCARFAQELATISMNVGEYDEIVGRSYVEIAAESRSQHKSQGFGSVQRKGAMLDYLRRVDTRVNAGTAPKAERSIFEGIDTARTVTPSDQESLALVEAQVAIEAIADRQQVALGDSVPVHIAVYKHGVRDSSLTRTMYLHGDHITQPYWLMHPRIGDLFAFASDSIADDERQKGDWLSVPVTLQGRTAPIMVRTPALYRYADPVRGDIQRPVITTPAVAVTFARDVELVQAGASFTRPFEVTLRSAFADSQTVSVKLITPAGLHVDTAVRVVRLAPGTTRTVTFITRGALPVGSYDVSAEVTANGHTYTDGYIPVEYDHITPERMYRFAVVHMQSVNVRLPHGLALGYVQGVGDNVAPALQDLGIPVTFIDPAALPVTTLSRFSTIVVGPRAYQANQTLIDNSGYLLAYVRNGGNLVVQYGQAEMQQSGIMPYPMTLSRPAARVTEEDAAVTVLDPKSSFLNRPNIITQSDFGGWVQERATYMPTTFDSHYATVLQMNDSGEPPNKAGLLSTSYGKGRYIYVTLALFRQLPAAVPGGVRIFANLLR